MVSAHWGNAGSSLHLKVVNRLCKIPLPCEAASPGPGDLDTSGSHCSASHTEKSGQRDSVTLQRETSIIWKSFYHISFSKSKDCGPFYSSILPLMDPSAFPVLLVQSMPGMYPEKTIIQKDTCTRCSLTAAGTWKQAKCPSNE